jgi:hypothetical protein
VKIKEDIMFIHEALLQNPISREWNREIRKIYQAFYQRLTHTAPLIIKIGKGGLSFYKEIKNDTVFVCHFNARPQSNKQDSGFADFRFDTIGKFLNVDNTIQLIQPTASKEILIKVNKLWCSLHFPLRLADHIAKLFVQHIVTKIE